MKNVFVLNSGRCGSLSFARACGHLDNYTVGHESRSQFVGDVRLAYPPNHIEVDNRLSWFLGPLAGRFAGQDTFYVHLRRDPAEVAASFARRWESTYRASMIRAYAHGIIMRTEDWDEGQVRAVCDDYVRTVNTNIEAFLIGRSSMTMDIVEAPHRFAEFVERIGATGNLHAAVGEFSIRHNSG